MSIQKSIRTAYLALKIVILSGIFAVVMIFARKLTMIVSGEKTKREKIHKEIKDAKDEINEYLKHNKRMKYK